MIGPLPPAVYLDTSVVVAALFDANPHHRAALDFCADLNQRSVPVYFSQLLRIELLQSLRIVATTPALLSGATRRRYRLQHRGSDAGVRAMWFDHGLETFERFLGEFARVYTLPINESIIEFAAIITAEHHLKSNDAVHVASAVAARAQALATIDADFARVETVEVLVIRDH